MSQKDPPELADFRFRAVAGRWLVTNDSGHYEQLSGPDLAALKAGRLPKDPAVAAALEAKGFLRSRQDFTALARRWGALRSHLWGAPNLHIVVVTLRCNHKCLYCHSSAVDPSRTEMDMSFETARRTVDFILSGPSPSVMIEFQGGEPLLNWPVIRFVVEYARERAAAAGKQAALSLVSNFSLMTEEKLDWLLARDVALCTSLDGPEDLHKRNRIFLGGNGQAHAVEWLKKVQRRFEAGLRGEGPRVYRPNALMTTTRFSLSRAREIVDTYVDLGLEGMFLRPLSPVGFAKRVWDKIGYAPKDFVAFYRESLDYILELNYRGVDFSERQAVLLLSKVLAGADPGYVDLRFPAGGALGCLAYNYDGRVFTTDEGRMADHEGDPMFCLGDVAVDAPNALYGRTAAKAYVTAGVSDGQPLCAQCAYKPFCGASPELNHESQGTLWGRTPSNGHCGVMMGVFDVLFEKLQDPKAAAVFESWLRPRHTPVPERAPAEAL